MEVFLYNSTVCRLCGEENDNGTLLYSNEENNQNLSEIINTYLPLKVSDDGELPRTICPGCTIQLEATVEFLNLIINGQKIIRELYQREKEYKKNILNSSTTEAPEVISEKIIYEINTSDGVYHVEHPISLQVAGLEKPKRKRGRPPKKAKSPEDVVQEAVAKEKEEIKTKSVSKDEEEPSGKRRRKAPTRFKEAVQGKELEKIFLEEGMIDMEETDHDKKPDIESLQKPKATVPQEPEVIGHMEESGELVVVVKGKGRGRPKGRMRQTREQCAICGMEFSSVGRYMSHIAQHGPVQFVCGCGEVFPTRLQFEDHQEDTGHTGRSVRSCVAPRTEDDSSQSTETQNAEVSEVSENSQSSQEIPHSGRESVITKIPELSDLSVDPLKGDDDHQDTVITEDANSIANVSIKAPNDVEEQVQTKKGKVKLKCNYCDKLFSNRQNKSLHIKAVHLGEKPFVCNECGARFAYPQSLAVHRVAHRRTRAPRPYACDLCGKVLNHPSSVVYHKQAEHAAQRYVCGTCGKHFRHKQLLQRHQLVHSQARPFTCKICNSTFKTKANMLNHQLLHTGVKKFSCDICKQRFAHKTSLTLHMRWHTGVKPFSCYVCGKSFSQKGNLSEHQRIHTGEKPYQCGECPRRFTTSSQHRLHARRHAARRAPAAERLQCNKCGKRMASRHLLLMHYRRDECTARLKRPERKQPQKQISLLVTDKPQQSVDEGEKIELTEETENGTEERVIYVAYDANDADAPAFHILDPEQAVNIEETKVLTTCELYSGPSLLVPQQIEELKVEMNEELEEEPDIEGPLVLEGENIPVTDEAGNPLHFTMQDGTRLAITSIDGKTLQVITQDGQTIPVEINGYNNEEDTEEVIASNIKNVEETSPVTHYYTIV